MVKEEVKTEAPVKEQKPTKFYFKNCTHPGGGISMGFKVAGDPTTEKLVKFTKYAFKVRGDDLFEGYLVTEDPKEVEVLRADRYADEIDKAEYDKALKDGRQVV